jgi:hypothetical protein
MVFNHFRVYRSSQFDFGTESFATMGIPQELHLHHSDQQAHQRGTQQPPGTTLDPAKNSALHARAVCLAPACCAREEARARAGESTWRGLLVRDQLTAQACVGTTPYPPLPVSRFPCTLPTRGRGHEACCGELGRDTKGERAASFPAPSTFPGLSTLCGLCECPPVQGRARKGGDIVFSLFSCDTSLTHYT